LQTTGKIDRNKLAAIAIELPELSVGSVAPRTPSELAVASIFADALKKSTLGADDDLFALGADSLTAIHVLFRLDELTPRPLTLAELFESRTVARVAARIDEARLRDAAPEVSAAP
jgi:enterobactin synthetase component F